MRKQAEVEGWTDWQTMVVYSYISNDQRDQKKAQTMALRAIQQRRQGGGNLDTLANQFSRTFRKYRDQVKQQWDEEESDALQERGEFEARQIEGKTPEPTGNQAADIFAEIMDIMKSDPGMGSGAPGEWVEPNWKEIASFYMDEAEREQNYQDILMGRTREQELPPDITEGLKTMGIRGAYDDHKSKVCENCGQPIYFWEKGRVWSHVRLKDANKCPQALPKKSKEAKMEVKYTLKGKKFISNFANPKQAGSFVVKAAQKWGNDFKAEPITSGISYVDGAKPENIVTAKALGAPIERTAGFNFFFPGQALREFYPEIQHELVDYPNATNAPMDADIAGNTLDAPSFHGNETEGPGFLTAALESTFDNLTKVSYVSTSPAGAAGLGLDFKPQIPEGQQQTSPDEIRRNNEMEDFPKSDSPGMNPLLKENEIKGEGFTQEFGSQYGEGPDALSVLAGLMKTAGTLQDKENFGTFLKRVMAELAATFISAYKLTSRPPLNKIPGIGEIQLDQIEQQQLQGGSTTLNITGSRVKALVEKLTDSDIQNCINDAWAQGAVWVSSPSGGMVYECFVRAETLDSESLNLKYKFVTGYRDSGI